jgi:predicted DNA-binding transcriptional regulator YafY
MHELLIRAIRERRLLMFAYRDTVRVVEAHRYGEAGNGGRLLNAWLRPGHSRTTPDGGWRSFALDDIERLQLLDETFAGPREGYAARDSRFATVFAELSAAPADAPVADTRSHVGEPPGGRHIPDEDPRKDEIGA